MKYKFGVMSNVWEIEAEDLVVAKMGMIMFLRQKIPIAIYEPIQESFMPEASFIEENMEYKTKEVNNALHSVKECVNESNKEKEVEK